MIETRHPKDLHRITIKWSLKRGIGYSKPNLTIPKQSEKSFLLGEIRKNVDSEYQQRYTGTRQ